MVRFAVSSKGWEFRTVICKNTERTSNDVQGRLQGTSTAVSRMRLHTGGMRNVSLNIRDYKYHASVRFRAGAFSCDLTRSKEGL